MNEVSYFGLELLPWLQSFEQLKGIAALFAALVKIEYTISFLIPAIFYFYSPRIGLSLFLLIGFDTAIGEALRVLLAEPRPWWVLQELIPIDRVDSIYSSPAGYASFSACVIGYFFHEYRNKWILYVGIPLSLICCVAKMYEAAAMPSHILLGYIQGCITVSIFLKYENKLREMIFSPSFLTSLFVLLGIVASLYAMLIFSFVIHEHYTLPQEWTRFRVLPSVRLSKGGSIMLLGMFTGCYLAMRYNGSLISGLTTWRLGRKLAAYVIGATGFIFLMFVVREILADGDNRLANGMVNYIFAGAAAYWWFMAPLYFLQKDSQTQQPAVAH